MPEQTTVQLLGELKGRMDATDSKINDIHQVIMGNGQSGLLERVIVNTENVESLEDETKELCKSIETIGNGTKDLKDSILALKEILTAHITNEQIHTIKGLLLKKEVITIFILMVITIHSLLPENINVFDAIKHWFGF